jgi:hypothetical protein
MRDNGLPAWACAAAVAVAVSAAGGCSADETCDAVYARAVTAACYAELVRAEGMSVCRTELEKVVVTHCLVSPDGVVHIATTGNGELRGTTWRHDSALTAEERNVCEGALANLGSPQPARSCE